MSCVLGRWRKSQTLPMFCCTVRFIHDMACAVGRGRHAFPHCLMAGRARGSVGLVAGESSPVPLRRSLTTLRSVPRRAGLERWCIYPTLLWREEPSVPRRALATAGIRWAVCLWEVRSALYRPGGSSMGVDHGPSRCYCGKAGWTWQQQGCTVLTLAQAEEQ